MSATVLGCMFDSVKAVARHYFGERQRITESVREYEQQGGVRLLQQRTRSDDRSAAGSKSSGGRPKKRPVRALTTALWQAAIESVAVKQGTNEYRVMATVAFWIGSLFIIGSLLFIIGAGASMVGSLVLEQQNASLANWQATGLVSYTYFTGGAYYTLGAYLGFFHVINAGHGFDNVGGHGFQTIRWWAWPPSDDGGGHGAAAYWGSLSYLIGALLFQLAVVYPLFAPHSWGFVPLLLFESLPTAVGALFFTIAASIEYNHNKKSTPADRVWWLVFTYLVGSVLFWVAATVAFAKFVAGHVMGPDFVASFTGYEPETISLWLVDAPYTVGSFSFWVGSWVQLRMWKAEQHGLGFMSEMNGVLAKDAKPVNIWDQVTLMLTTLLATTTVLNLGLSHAYTAAENKALPTHHTDLVEWFFDIHDFLDSVSACVIAHAILLLETVLHATPSIHPYDYLQGLMRVVMLLLLIHEVLTTVELLWQPDPVSLEDHDATGVVFAAHLDSLNK